MFTGLIETTSNIQDFSQNDKGAVIKLRCPFYNEVKLGDSICANGACLTVIKIDGEFLSFEISNETLSVCNIDGYQKGKTVNIERAMLCNSRFDGHIVSGHIDGTAKVKNIKNDGFSFDMKFETTSGISKYIINKGSITINGVSLTIKNVSDNLFSIEVIPHTMKKTNLNLLKIGDIVNIETDIIARYVEKFLSLGKNTSNISIEMLRDNGYL